MRRASVVAAAVASLAHVSCAPEAGEPARAAQKDSGSAAETSSGDAEEIAALRAALEAEREAREQLTAEVEWLGLQVEELMAAASEADRSPPAGTRSEGDAGAGERGADERSDTGGGSPWFDAEALADAGVSPDEVGRLREVFDASELGRLQLEDRARRDGTYGKRAYWEALRDARVALREELGDRDFDRLLFASGRDNRIVVQGVLNDSPAQRAGVRPGDEILSYDGSRVFRTTELKRASATGRAGEQVELLLLRDGERVRTFLPRGPLGVQTLQAHRPPVAAW